MTLSYGRLMIELHCNKFTHAAGTFIKNLGDRGDIHSVSDVEELLREENQTQWSRAYLRAPEAILAVYARHGRSTKFLVRAPLYDGTLPLSFVGSPSATAAVTQWEDTTGDSTIEVHTTSEAERWATTQLTGATNTVSAILLNRGAIRAAFELKSGRVKMVSQGPRTTRR